jgi:flagellar motor switch protein FliM
MEKVLNQEEIDAMVRVARGGGRLEKPISSDVHVEPWDVRRAGQIGREQLQAITLLHEGFARSLTNSLGAYLRVDFATVLVSAEHLTYREFLQNIPETTYLVSCRLDPLAVNAALQLDLKVAFPIIDLLLGGEGKGMSASREITEIEEQILDSVGRIVCRELGLAWQALSLNVVLEERLKAAEAQRLMPPEEKILSLSFEITMPDVRGGLNLAVPATVSNALLRKISASWSQRRSRNPSDLRHRLMRRLLDCPFEVELSAGNLQAPVSVLSAISAGDLLDFRRKVAEPASVVIAGIEMFHAVPARCASSRAARFLEPVPQPENTGTQNDPAGAAIAASPQAPQPKSPSGKEPAK